MYRCVIMDNSGFVVLHPDFLYATESDEYLFSKVHITVKEPRIAQSLIEKRLMIQQHCLDFENVDERHFWVVRCRYSWNCC